MDIVINLIVYLVVLGLIWLLRRPKEDVQV